MKYEPIHGELELVAEQRTDKQKTGSSSRKSKTRVFEERLKLRTKGDIYHPDFLLYNLAIGLGLTQQDIRSESSSGTSSGTLNSYRFFGQLLRKKPYPLSFYTNKSEDLIARQFLGSLRTELENSGISLALRSEEWPMGFHYSISKSTQESLDSSAGDSFTRKDKRFSYSLDHNFTKLSHMRFEFNRDDVSQRSSGVSTDTKTDRYNLLHNLIFGSKEQHRLDSLFSFLDQSGTFAFKNTQWGEHLRLQHSPNFMTNYDFTFTESKQQTTANSEMRGQFGFEHRLYESLITTGNVFFSKSEFGNNTNFTERGGTLNFSYKKKNRWGTLFSGYSAGMTERVQSGSGGTGTVVNESHTVPAGVTPTVELSKRNIDVSSIEVRNAAVAGLLFSKDLDYRIVQTAGKVRLEIIMNEGTNPDFTAVGQTFFVTYNFLTEPQRQENILRQRFSLRERFNNGLSLYYSHQRQDEDIKSNITDITVDEFRINTFGVDYNKKGLALRAEYRKEDSTQISSVTKQLKARYSWQVKRNLRASVWASNQWLTLDESPTRDVRLFNTGGTIYSRLTSRYILSVGINYQNELDSIYGTTEGLDFRTELKYNYRQLSIATGLEYNLLKRIDSENESIFIYVRNQLFFVTD